VEFAKFTAAEKSASSSQHCQVRSTVKFAALSSSQHCQVRSTVKSTLIFFFFFDIQGTVYKEFVPASQTVNGKWTLRNLSVNCEVLERLREGIRRRRPHTWKNNWFLHHDTAPAHTSLVVRQFLTSKNVTVIPHSHTPIRLTSPLRIFPIPQDGITAERASF